MTIKFFSPPISNVEREEFVSLKHRTLDFCSIFSMYFAMLVVSTFKMLNLQLWLDL